MSAKNQKSEPYQPMAVPEPSQSERVEALELRVKELEKGALKHHRYHFDPMGLDK
jgi:hypothetical protein